MFALNFREELPEIVAKEFDMLFARLKGYLLEEHNEDGTHITRDRELDFVPVGSIMPYAGATAPNGWELCDGGQLGRVTHKGLFDIIGTTYGAGDGSTTFNKPDLRQRFPLGLAASGTGAALGATGGSIDHTHTAGAHTHGISTDGAHTHTVTSHDHNIASDGGHDHGGDTGLDGGHTHGGSTGSAGSHNHGNSGLESEATGTSGGVVLEYTAGGDELYVAVGGHAHDTVTGSAPDTDGVSDHSHSITGENDHSHEIGNEANHNHGGVTSATAPSTDSQGGHSHGGVTASDGAITTSAVNPPFLAINYIILTAVA